MTAFQIFTALLGRICFSLYFIVGGIQHILHWEIEEQLLIERLSTLLGYVGGSITAVTAIDFLLDWSFAFFVFLTACQLLGGIFVLLGIRVRMGAFLILVYLVVELFLVHQFWGDLVSIERSERLLGALRDLSLIGATLILLCVGKRVLVTGGTRGDNTTG